MSIESHAHMKCGTLKKSSISRRGYAEFTYKGHFLTIKIAYENSWIKNPNGGNML
jgi:hypothetical protein